MTKTAGAKKKEKKNISSGIVHIKATFNNTLVTITDTHGNVVAGGSAGGAGFKGSRKSTPYAAQVAARNAASAAKAIGLRQVEIEVAGPGPGREAAIRAIADFFKVMMIKDTTGIPFNGVRPENERRV